MKFWSFEVLGVNGNDTLRELSSLGKSGCVFFLSLDDLFMHIQILVPLFNAKLFWILIFPAIAFSLLHSDSGSSIFCSSIFVIFYNTYRKQLSLSIHAHRDAVIRCVLFWLSCIYLILLICWFFFFTVYNYVYCIMVNNLLRNLYLIGKDRRKSHGRLGKHAS